MAELPTVRLTTTLADLYRQASPKNAQKRIGQVLCGANSGVSLTDHFPRSLKYIYQDWAFNNIPKDELSRDNHALRSSMALKYLSLVPQREYFVTGNTTAIMFDRGDSEEQIAQNKLEAEMTLRVLPEEQRPRLVFCQSPTEIPMKENGLDLLAFKIALDAFVAYPLVVDVETQWFLNTKGALARSGLPTPRCTFLELEGFSADAGRCCEACRAGDEHYIPSECSGRRGRWLKEQMSRMIEEVKIHPLPFVLKNQSSYGGAGTYVITTEGARAELIHDLSNNVLRKLFSQVTQSNQHLQPGTVLLSEMVADPVDDCGLTLFVTDSGEGIFLAVSKQILGAGYSWVGSTVNYKQQEQLARKFERLTRDIAAWLHEYGYVGPAGADILETRDGEGSAYHIVDLNVRTPGSLCLPLLRDHFEGRGLHSAGACMIQVKDSREGFVEKWRDALESGRICILAWCAEPDGSHSLADIAVGAEDDERLRRAMEELRDAAENLTF